MDLALKGLLSAEGALTGFVLVRFLFRSMQITDSGYLRFSLCAAAALALAVAFFFAGGFIISAYYSLYDSLEKKVKSLTIFDLAVACAGLIVGLAISFFLTLPLSGLKWLGMPITIMINFLFGYLGVAIAIWKRHDITDSFHKSGSREMTLEPKVLDTSVIIDGRICDVLRTGFLEGELIIPEFVLAELRHIADSSDAGRRMKGKHGLDVLNRIRNECGRDLRIEDYALPSGAEVDVELVNLARKNQWTVLTTDHNLNKIASIKGVRVLNINELNNASKTLAIPGEDLMAHISREGTEPGQGVASLPDGTMIVVEDGKRFMGQDICVTLYNVYQKDSGRVLFARVKNENGTNGLDKK